MSSLSDERSFRDAWRRMKAGLPWGATASTTVLAATPAAACPSSEDFALMLLGTLAVVTLVVAPATCLATYRLKRAEWPVVVVAAIFAAINVLLALIALPVGVVVAIIAIPVFLITWACTSMPVAVGVNGVSSKLASCSHTLTPTLSPGERGQNEKVFGVAVR
jgi:hypothetical protein